MKSRTAVILLLCVLLGACAGWDPNEGRSGSSYQKTPDGYYRVKRGDSLYAIAFKFGLDWKQVASWNGIRAPYTIYPDQQLRMSAPAGASPSRTGSSGKTVVKAAPASAKKSTTADYVPDQSSPPSSQATTTPQKTTPPSGTAAASKPPSRKPASSGAAPGKWQWPVEGRLLSSFKANDPARKGIDIAGTVGQPVFAAAGGEVVYSGSGLIGYGELIIIKHSDQMLSAYAHNSKRLVMEGQSVAGGTRIAEMGKNDRNQAMLHFEIRKNGTPQDPLKYLPRR